MVYVNVVEGVMGWGMKNFVSGKKENMKGKKTDKKPLKTPKILHSKEHNIW